MVNMDGSGNVRMEVLPLTPLDSLRQRVCKLCRADCAGDKCIYRHALPPGYVLKSQLKKEDEEEKITLEQFIETERHKLPPSSELHPVTAESFAAWHKAKKEAEREADSKKKELAKEKGTMTGKEFFLSGAYKVDEEEEDGEDFDLSAFRREVEALAEEGETFQLGGDNAKVETNGEDLPEQETVGQEDGDK